MAINVLSLLWVERAEKTGFRKRPRRVFGKNSRTIDLHGEGYGMSDE
jgi:hypothetical protein